MIKTGDWVKTREKNIENEKQTKNKFELSKLLETSSESEESDNNI